MTERKPVELIDLLTPKDKERVPVGRVSNRWPIEKIDGHWKYAHLYDDRAINYVARLGEERVKHKFDCIFMITGERRTGKSTLASLIARAINAQFPVDNIIFRLEDFYESMGNAPSADPSSRTFPQIILDESGFDFYAKEWNQSLQRDGVKILEVVGKKRLILYFLVPHGRKLNSDIREEMAHIWINTDPPKYLHEDRGYAVVRTGSRDIYRQRIWWFPSFAFFFPELKGEFWNAYESKKDSFIYDVTVNRKKKPSEFSPRMPVLG